MPKFRTSNPLAATIISNAPWAATGYGTQTKQLALRMIRDGHSMAVSNNYGLEATSTVWEGIEVYPKGGDGAYSNDIVVANAKDWSRRNPKAKPVIFTLYDCWVFLGHPSWDKVDIPIVSWVPIDHMPTPPKVRKWLEREDVTPVAMSHYGSAQLTAAGIDHHCIPHGIETSLYKPTPTVRDAGGVRRTGRELMGVPEDAHVTGIINANKGTAIIRKAFAEQLMAWAIFAKDRPDAWLYLHTEFGGGMGGIPLQPILDAVGAPMDRVRKVNQYQFRVGVPDEAMAAIYSGLDLLLAPTLGEGFGLTVAEASSCGTRAIVQDFTAQPELIADGWLVGGQPLWDPAQEAWFSIPSVPQIGEALALAYDSPRGTSEKARQHIIDKYDADMIYETGWRPLWESM